MGPHTAELTIPRPLTTNDAKLDRTFRLLRQHGMDISDALRHASRTVLYEKYVVPAYNYRITDIQAAVGRVQLKRLPSLIERRRAAAAVYRHLLGTIPGVTLPV
jgi:dTDP-4-amino-4,6-dideoxygalactose transaminase